MATGNFLQNGILEEIWHGVDGCRAWLGTQREYIFQKANIPNNTLIIFTDSDDFEGVTFKKIEVNAFSLEHKYNNMRWHPDWEFTINGEKYTREQMKDILYIDEHDQLNVGNYKTRFTIKDPTKYKWSDGSISTKTIEWKISSTKLLIPHVQEENGYEYTGTWVFPEFVNYNHDYMVITGQTTGIGIDKYEVSFKLRSNGYVWEDDTRETKVVSWRIVKKTLFDVDKLFYDDVHNVRKQVTSYTDVTLKSGDLVTLSLEGVTDNKAIMVITSNGNRGVEDHVFSTPQNKGLDTTVTITVDYPITDIINGDYTPSTQGGERAIINPIIDDTYGTSSYSDVIMNIIEGSYVTNG